MEKTKVAILGCGFIANIHMECYQRFVPDAQVVAVYGRNKEKAKASNKIYVDIPIEKRSFLEDFDWETSGRKYCSCNCWTLYLSFGFG